MTIKASSLIDGGVPIGAAVFLEESQPDDVTIRGRRYLKSGLVEDDESLFDTSFFTVKSIFNDNLETSSYGADFIVDVALIVMLIEPLCIHLFHLR